jgi:hypothetical protein
VADLRKRLARVIDESKIFVKPDTVRAMRACLHPDRWQDPKEKARSEKASQLFESLPIRTVEPDKV